MDILSLQRINNRATACETLLRLLRKCLHERGVHVRGKPRNRFHWRGKNGVSKYRRVIAIKRQIAGEKPVRHHTKRIDVGRGLLWTSQPLLGRLVTRSASARRDRVTRVALARAYLRGEAEVQHLHSAFVVHHHVLGLHIAVDHLPRMCVVESGSNLTENREFRLRRRLRVSPHPPLEARAARKVHHEVIVDRRSIHLQRARARDVRMVEVRDESVVGTYVIHLVRVAAHLRRQTLHGHAHAAHLIEALVDDAHAALAEHILHHVATRDHVAWSECPASDALLLRTHRRPVADGFIH